MAGGLWIFMNKPTFVLQNALKKQVKTYKINYQVDFKATPKGRDAAPEEPKTLDVFFQENKLKTIEQFLKKENGTSVVQNTQSYFELTQGNFLCFTPVFIDNSGNSSPIGPLTCNTQQIAKDPLSTDERIIPATQ